MSLPLAADPESRTVPADPALDHLRRLHYARFAFAIAWAAAFAGTASTLGPISVTLLLLYPAVDAAATVWDLRASGPETSRGPLALNAALSVIATVGLAAAAASGEAGVLPVWGAWAVAAGLAQLVVAARRRRLGGQWPLVLSGGLSVLAGAAFVAAATEDDPSLTGLAGYAALGALFFLAAGLSRRPRTHS